MKNFLEENEFCCEIYKIFVAMDDDGSGTITANEIAQMLCGFGCDVSPKVVQAVIRSSDKSGDGEIDFEEFLAAITSKIKLNECKADIQAMFKKFDRNKDGLLSAEELVIAWSETLKTRITVKEAAALIQQADLDGREP
ncbi:EF hand [Dictyocaulus viviparus]|uniref:EF hand n=1 Tax=Dictyocaulus viviparus TaxID=29172 RepID=A0A0D8XX93_DICVI|nr:EF hand [Dictyocaulus viviparus]